MSKELTRKCLPRSKRKSAFKQKTIKLPKHLEHINQMAAGIDIGSESHFVAVPEGCDEQCVRNLLLLHPI